MKGWFLKNLQSGHISSMFLSAINSGMLISYKYIKDNKFRYDERLDSYGTDDQFMLAFSQNKGVCCALDSIIEHDLTLSTLNGNSAILLDRYSKLLKSWYILYSNGFFRKTILSLYVLIHSSYLRCKFKDLLYFKTGLKIINEK